MHPYTIDGMATLEKGVALKSSLLENYLQEITMSEKNAAKKPEHVRMLCFIMKMKEKKGERVDVFFVSPDEKYESVTQEADLMPPIEQLLRTKLTVHDVFIEYSDRVRIVALFDRTESQIENFTKEIIASGVATICKHI